MPSRALGARILGVLSVLVAMLLTTGQGAYAASKTVRDTTGDVYSLTGDTPTKVSGPSGDIVSVRTTHTRRVVRIKVQASHLKLDQTLLFAKVKTGPTGPTYFFNGTADIGMRMAIMTKGQAHIVVCPGISMRFRPALGYVMAVIPRTCLGDPRWVQVGAALATTASLIKTLADDNFDPMSGSPAGSDGTIDIAGLGSISAAQMNAQMMPLPLGPRVHVG